MHKTIFILDPSTLFEILTSFGHDVFTRIQTSLHFSNMGELRDSKGGLSRNALGGIFSKPTHFRIIIVRTLVPSGFARHPPGILISTHLGFAPPPRPSSKTGGLVYVGRTLTSSQPKNADISKSVYGSRMKITTLLHQHLISTLLNFSEVSTVVDGDIDPV